jgi:adenylate kinase
MKGQCTLVFGVSGVGKTSACEAYVLSHPQTLFVSASSLLKSTKRMSGEALRTARREEIIDNQALLARALAEFRCGREARPILIDAHGVIDNDDELVSVPVSAIRALEPDRLVLLDATPELVSARRASDPRKRPDRAVEAIARELAAERRTVKAYAEELGVDLAVADLNDGVSLEKLLDT